MKYYSPFYFLNYLNMKSFLAHRPYKNNLNKLMYVKFRFQPKGYILRESLKTIYVLFLIFKNNLCFRFKKESVYLIGIIGIGII